MQEDRHGLSAHRAPRAQEHVEVSEQIIPQLYAQGTLRKVASPGRVQKTKLTILDAVEKTIHDRSVQRKAASRYVKERNCVDVELCRGHCRTREESYACLTYMTR